MIRPRNLPDANQLSLLAATILLAYVLTRFIVFPAWKISFQILGIVLDLHINIRTIVTLLVASLTATGAEWLLRNHPALGRRSVLVEHWLLPALTAWTISFPLYQLPLGPAWWAGFASGGALLMLVMVAEYIALDPDDVRGPVATAGLTAVSYALFLIMAITVRSAGLRLYSILPTLALAVFLVSLRTLHLRLHGRWALLQATVITFLIGQMVAALHYWRLSPVSFGLLLLGPAYALTTLIAGLEEGYPLRQAVIEPGIVLILLCGAALWIG